MLRDDDLGGFLAVLGLGKAQVVRTVDKDDHVGILFDGTGFAQVAEHRLAVAAGALDRVTGQLGQGDDRDIEFLGGHLEGTGDRGDLLLAHAPQFGGPLHQLEIVHDDQPYALALDQALDLGTELHDRKARRVIDIERGLGKRFQAVFQLLPFMGVQFGTALDLVGRQAGLGRHQTLGQLDGRHFQGEDGDRHVVVDRRVARDIEGERRLTDGRTGRQDDQVGRLPAHRHLVDGREAGRNAAQTGLGLHALHVFHGRLDDGTDLLHILLDIVLDGGEDLRLGHVDQVIDVDRVVVGILEDVERSGD